MASFSFTTNNQIIRDLYSTPQEAIDASKLLGCDGYRTYVINGETKYVPCSSFLQYENALRYRVVQGKIGAFGRETFGDKLVGLQFANSKDEIQGDPFFTLGNFSIKKSVNQTLSDRQLQLQVNESEQSLTPKRFTVESIADRNLNFFQGKDYVETLRKKVSDNLTVKVLFDKRKLENYVLFSSLKDRIKNSIVEIFNKFPAALRLEPVSITTPSVSDYSNFPLENRSELKVNLYGLFNPFNIEYTTNGLTVDGNENVITYRNFSKTFSNYVLHYNGIDYPITSAVLPNSVNDNDNGLRLTVQGNPFKDIVDVNNSVNVRFYIKLKDSIIEDFYVNLSDMSSFLLNKDLNTGLFTSEFLFPTAGDDGNNITVKETLTFPVIDDFNIDMFSDSFDRYLVRLNDISDSYDQVKTNLISRFLTTDSLKEFDTSDRKADMLFQLYGNTFDNIKKYIDGIAFMRNVSYDKIGNIPDLLIKNFANMLGLNSFEIEDEDSLIESLFSYGGQISENSRTPAEIDIEIWRRILINCVYLYKSKGTRKSIEFILKLVGLPEDVFDLNEYIYLAENRLNVTDVLNKIYTESPINDPQVLVEQVPFDSQGFPTIPVDVVFQENGGFIREDKNNVGVFDFGRRYVDSYRKYNGVYLFDLYRTIDNVKSWVYYDNLKQFYKDSKNSYTEYESKHSDLVVNSKELEVYLALDRVLDVSVYRQYSRNIINVNYDINIANKFSSEGLTFNQFLKKSVDGFINPTNRKTIKTYPTLSKVYFDYLKSTDTPMDNIRSLEFLNKFDSSWVKLVEQFVPATTILNAGKKIQNSVFLDNKFIYKHGINSEVEWLGTDGSEFQQKALKPVYQGTTIATDNKADIIFSNKGNIEPFNVSGNLGNNLYGIDPTRSEYYGGHYLMTEYCDDILGNFHIWQSGVDYGDDSIFNGNINSDDIETTDMRYGVFVVYENRLYRLNTKYMFNDTGDIPEIHTSGGYSTIESSLPPNKATVTNFLDVTRKIWDVIPYNAKSRNVIFSDKLDLDIRDDERSFYVNSIGRGLAYVGLGINFDCPPPKPHVCYYDFGGQPISITLDTLYSFSDYEGNTYFIKQPKFYGYSKNHNLNYPDGVYYGSKYNWGVPYQKRFSWIENEIYYKGEIIANIHPNNKANLIQGSNVFVVTDDFVIGTSTYPSPGHGGLELIGTAFNTSGSGDLINPATVSDGTTGGMYGRYEDREATDPFMHIDPAFINKVTLDPNSNVYSINLSKSINLSHVFKGDSAETTYKVKDNIVGGEFYISDSISLDFDGFYSLDSENTGPFYTLDEENVMLHTLVDKVTLQPNINNYISIQSLNENFRISGNDLSLINTNPGYYLITKSSFLRFSFSLYFESSENLQQSVDIKLINSLGFVYDTQNFVFNGSDTGDLRQYTFEYSGFFNSGEKIYLVVSPINFPCDLCRYEIFDYIHDEPDETEFNQLNDPRFRLSFYSGFSGRGEYLDGYSIKPIYNLSNLDTNNLILRTNENYYINIPLLNILHSTDPNFSMNKLFLPYYESKSQGGVVYDSTLYDKSINFDKIDFSFKIRSKSNDFSSTGLSTTNTNNSRNIGVTTAQVEFDFSYSDYFLGKSIRQTDYNDVSNAITIGKNIRPRIKNHKRDFTYSPKYSFYGNNSLGVESENTLGSFIEYDTGILDYEDLNLSNNLISELKLRKRYLSGLLNSSNFELYKYENDIYDTEIYQDILNVVPTFNSQIVNYELNDVVKVPVDSYKIINETENGLEVQTISVFKLYVCVNDIDDRHCYRLFDNATSTYTQGEIHEIYRPRGARSCFIEIEKYSLSNYSPWGYEDSTFQTTNNPNLYDYINKNISGYNPSVMNEYHFGDIVLANIDGSDEFFRFIYQKPLIWDSTKQYYRGDYVLMQVTEGINTNYRFFIARRDNLNQDPTLATETTPTIHWRRIMTNDELFSHRSLIGLPGWVDSIGTSWLTMDQYTVYANSVGRFPKTLPVSDFGVPLIATGTTVTGITFSNRWDNFIKSGYCYIDNCFQSFDGYDVSTTKKMLRGASLNYGRYYGTDMYKAESLPYEDYDANVYYEPGSIIKHNNLAYIKLSTSPLNTTPVVGEDWGVYYQGMLISGSLYETDNYKDYYGYSRLDKTNILLKPSVPFNNFSDGSVFLAPFLTDSSHTYPLFERLGRLSEKNNPTIFVASENTGITYNKNSKYLGYKYSVNRGVLYKFIDDIPMGTYSLQPYEDSDKWVEKDFCLVNNFKFYKDRTRVTVYESSIESLNDFTKNSLYFFKPNLQLKNGFTNRSFIGSTLNNKLITALDKFYDVTDANRTNSTSLGRVDFRKSNGDIIMDYYLQKDEVGFPLTGEFIGKLNVSNPCGQVATTFFGLLFDTDINLLDRRQNVSVPAIFPTQTEDVLPYVVRVIVTQTGEANASVLVRYFSSSSEETVVNRIVSKNSRFDFKYDAIPQTDFEIEIKYSVQQNQTKFKSSFIDSSPIFLNGALENSSTLFTSIMEDNFIETRTIRLKNLNSNRTVFFNLEGIVNSRSLISGNQGQSNIFDVINLNLNTSNL